MDILCFLFFIGIHSRLFVLEIIKIVDSLRYGRVALKVRQQRRRVRGQRSNIHPTYRATEGEGGWERERARERLVVLIQLPEILSGLILCVLKLLEESPIQLSINCQAANNK